MDLVHGALGGEAVSPCDGGVLAVLAQAQQRESHDQGAGQEQQGPQERAPSRHGYGLPSSADEVSAAARMGLLPRTANPQELSSFRICGGGTSMPAAFAAATTPSTS